jgi:hypothetical protein
MSTSEKVRAELTNKLSSVLLTFVRAVFTEQLEASEGNYRIGYGPDWRDDSELHISVMKKFGIKIYFIDKQRSDNPIKIIFVLTEKLGELFKSYDFAPFLIATLQDNGEDFFDLTDKEDVAVFNSCSPLFTNSKNEAIYAEFVNAVEKRLLLTTINYS